MCAELFYVVLAVLGLFIVDKFSTSLAVVICGLFIYFYIQVFSKGFDKDRFIASLIIKSWRGFLFLFCFWKNLFVAVKNIFFPPKKYVKVSNSASFSHCGETACLEREIDIIVLNISQYYLHSWYDKVGDNEEFILHLNSVIKNALVGLCSKVITLNRKRISYIILQIYLHFFIHFIDAKKKSEDFKQDNFEMKHWATQDNMTEWCYLQSLMSSLIDTFGPVGHHNSLHSKHSPILHNFVVEILTEHILHPLSNLLSDPNQLNSWLLKLLETCVQMDESINSSSLDTENVPSSNVPSEKCNLGPKILLDRGDFLFVSKETERETHSNISEYMLGDPCKSDCNNDVNNDACEPEVKDSISMLKELAKTIDSEYLSPLISAGVKSSSNINLFENEFLSVRTDDNETCLSVSCDTSTIKRSKSADYIRQMPQLRALNMKDYNIVMQNDSNKMLVALKSEINPSGFIEQAEEAVEVPTLFSDVRISDTVQQSEAGFLPYTLYCIQYSGIFHDTGKSSEKPHFIKQEVSIKRRFREFLALQSRLEDNPSLKNYLKGIKGPSKWLALPFSNMDKKNIAERKSFLENYLKELCNHGLIAQSSELQEFLAYGGDATVAFVKKAADISVPRIDKMFVRGVKGAIDIIKTALPNTTVEGGCSTDGSTTSVKLYSEDTSPDHRFPEHLLEYSSREPEIRGLLRQYFKIFCNILQIEHIESYKYSDDYPQRASLLKSLYKLKVEKCCNCSETWDICDENFALENPFGNTLVDIMIESLKLSQLSSCHLFSLMKLLFPPSIDRFFNAFLDEFSEHHLAIFLHILHKALWPSESIRSNKKIIEVTSNQSCYIKLQKCLKGLIASSNVTMSMSWVHQLCLERVYLFLSSIQHQQLNRCLLFHIFDVIIDTVCSKD